MKLLLKLKKDIEADLKQTDDYIKKSLLETTNPTLTDIYTHILKSNGKQIRASLIIIICKLNKKLDDNVYKLAAGIELIHLASLIHDDIIDQAEVRRNQITVHQKFNLNNGIISGVHCYAVALKLITSIGNLKIIEVISDAVINLCEGECFQMNNRHNFDLNDNDYWDIIEKKTSSLFKASCVTAGILSNCNQESLNIFSKFGSTIGDIFQLVDDYLDIFDKKNKLSKKVLQDLKTGDISLPILIASQQSKSHSVDSISNYLKVEKNNIADLIRNEIVNKKSKAEQLLSDLELSSNLDQLNSILSIITSRVSN